MERADKHWKSIGIKHLDIELLKVDRSYQRELTSVYKSIIDNFDERKLGTIHVSKRVDGTHWIIDGQNRWAACRAIGRKTIRAEVYEGCTVEDEATIFSGLDERRALTPFSKFRARVRAGSPAEVAIEKLFASRGHSIVKENFRAPQVALWAWDGCRGETDDGPAVLAWAVDVYLKAWPAPKGSEIRSWIDGQVLKALAAVGARHREIPLVEMARKLADTTPEWLKASGRSMGMGSLEGRIAFMIVLSFNAKRTKNLLPQWEISRRAHRPEPVAVVEDETPKPRRK